MSLRLVSSNSDPFDDEEYALTPRQAVLVATYASIMADEAYDDLEQLGDAPITAAHHRLMVLDLFPPITWSQDSQWRRQAARAFDDLAADIDAGHSPIPTCTAEEMALHLVLDRARDMFTDGEADHLIVDVAPQPRDRDWNEPREYLFEDHDVLTLFDPTPVITEMLAPHQWFVTFNSEKLCDPGREYRR